MCTFLDINKTQTLGGETLYKGPELTNEPSVQGVCLDLLVVSSEDAQVLMNCHVYREGRGGWKLEEAPPFYLPLLCPVSEYGCP